MRVLKIKTNILNPVFETEIELKKNRIITIQNGKIFGISDSGDFDLDKSDEICLPGLIDLHVHLSQINAKGKHAPHLLTWLTKHIFKEEEKSKDSDYARKIANDFFNLSIKQGTTTSVIYVAPNKRACDIAFETAEYLGVRAFIGKTMMDVNSPENLKENSETTFEESVELFNKWDKKTPLLRYIFTPRFAPVCSSDLMRKIGNFARKNNAFIQSHLSENKDEINWVKELFPDSKNYTQVYETHRLLSSKSIMGHGIHLNNDEIRTLKKHNAVIAHCPDSNFFLKSGVFPWQKLKESGVRFGLASDVGAGTSLSMFHIMKMAIFRQDDYAIDPKEVFYRSTIGNAKILELEDKIGSVTIGKDADFIFVKQNNLEQNKDEMISEIVYRGSENIVTSVFVAGRQLL